MSILDITTLKTYFTDGSRPTGVDFTNLIDSLHDIIIPPVWGAISGTITAQQDLQSALSSKADTLVVNALKSSVTTLSSTVNSKADASSVTLSLDSKANWGNSLASYGITDAYTMSQTDSRIASIVGGAPAAFDTLQELAATLQADESITNNILTSLSTKVELSDFTTALNSKANTIDVYTKSQVDSAITNSISSPDWSKITNKPTTLSGYNLSSTVYTQTQVDGLLATKASSYNPSFTGNVSFGSGSTVTGLNKSTVGLGNVDNTSDISKPVSTATQTAINTAVSGITKSSIGLSNVDNTSDSNKPISDATQLALNTKVNTSDLGNLVVQPDLTGYALKTDLTTAITNLIDGAPDALNTLHEITNQLALDESTATALTNTVALKAPKASPIFTGTVDFSGAANITGLGPNSVGLANVSNAAQTLASVVPNTLPLNGQLLVGSSSKYVPTTISGDGSLSSVGSLTITKSNGVSFGTGAFATISNYVPVTRTINGKPLSADITITASDITIDNTTAKWNANQINSVSLSTLATGILKNTTTSGIPSIAVASTDYVAPSSYASSNGLTLNTFKLLGRTTSLVGPAEEITVGSGLSLSNGTLVATGAGGSVTNISVTTANGFSGTVATSTSTPAITISTTITGLLKGNGTSVTAAVNSDLPTMSATLGGAVPAPPNDSTKFLNGQGTWAIPASTYSLPTATSTVMGGVKPDGTSILNTAGAISVTPTSIGLGNVTNTTQTQASIVPNTIPTNGQLLVGNGTNYSVVNTSGDATISSTGAISVTKTNGTVFGSGATANISLYAPLISPTFTGTVTVPTLNVTTINGLTSSSVSLGNVTNDTQTKASIVPNTVPTAGQILIGSGTSYLPRSVSGDATMSSTGSITVNTVNGVSLTNYATLASPTFTGTVTIPTLNVTTLTGTALASYAPISSPTFTGTVTIPTGSQINNPTITNYIEKLYAPSANSNFTISLANGTIQELTTLANTTIVLPNSLAGQSYTIIINYGGAHTVTWSGGGNLRWMGGTAPTPTSLSGKSDIFVFICDGTNTFGASGGNNY